MKYICLGYGGEVVCQGMTAEERLCYREACRSYERGLHATGQMLGSEALQEVGTAVTVQMQQGELCVRGCTVQESERPLGAILVLDARDLNHAIQLLSQHPGVRHGEYFEVRPAQEAGDSCLLPGLPFVHE